MVINHAISYPFRLGVHQPVMAEVIFFPISFQVRWSSAKLRGDNKVCFCILFSSFFSDAFLSFSSDYMWSLSDQIETCFLMLLDHLDIFGSFWIIWKRNMTRNSEHLPQALDIVSNIAMVCDIIYYQRHFYDQPDETSHVPSANQNSVLWMNISNPIESSQSPSHQQRFPWFLDEFHWNL